MHKSLLKFFLPLFSIVVITLIVQGLKVTVFMLVSLILFACYYYSLRIFLKNNMTSLFLVLAVVLFLAFFNSTVIFAANILGGLSAIACFFLEKRKLKTLLFIDYKYIKSLSSLDLFAWTMFFIGIVCFGVQKGFQFFIVDSGHTFYEASIGLGFRKSLLFAPDLSYSGKLVKFHFLSTLLPFYFSHIFSVSYVVSAMFFSRLFLGTVFFTAVNNFFLKFKLKISAFFLLNLPFFWGIGLLPDSMVARCGLGQLSFFLGFVLIVFALYFFIEKKYEWFFVSAALLAFSKISFFVVLIGGVLLFFLRTWNLKKLVLFIAPLGVIFLLVTHLFLKGAHAHNLWILYPSFLLERFASWWWIWVFVLFTVVVYVYVKFLKDRTLCFLSSCALSGLLGFFFISEIAEQNSLQFYIATYFAVAIVFFCVLSMWASCVSRWMRNVVFGIIVLLILVSVIRQYNRVYENVRMVLFEYYRRDLSKENDDVIEAYSWLSNKNTSTGVVLFGKHYEKFDKVVFEPETGFVRSVLSGRQMFCEEYRGKGILMEADFSKRFSDVIHFYKTFVFCSDRSKQQIKMFYDLKCEDDKIWPLSFTNKLWHVLSFGREWYLDNWRQYIMQSLFYTLLTLPKTNLWAKRFLKNSCVTHIVLEKYDQPGEFLKSITKTIYKNKSVTILQVESVII